MINFSLNIFKALCDSWVWRMAWRDTRSQTIRLVLCVLSLTVGIGALSAIHALKNTVKVAIDAQSKSLLGADVLISSRKPIPEDSFNSIASLVRARARETAFSSMLSHPQSGHIRMVQVRALEGGFPFGSNVETSPRDAWTQLQAQRGIILEPALLTEFGVNPGDRLKLGALELTVLGSVSKGVPRSSRFSGFAPEIFVRQADLEATGLTGNQSLVYHHQALELTAGTGTEHDESVSRIRKAFSAKGIQVQTPENRRETMGEALQKAGDYLGLTAIAALILGGIGVAGTIHTHLLRRLPSVAILLCLGCSRERAFAVYLVQAAGLGVLGAILGGGSGALAHAGVVHFTQNSLPVAVAPFPQITAMLQTGSAGLFMCCCFALLPLLGILDISPAATLSERSPGRGRRPLLQYGLCLLLAGAAWVVARANGTGPARALAVTGVLVLVFLALTGIAYGLMHGARNTLRPGWPYLLRQGVSNLFRPHNQTLLFLLSTGLGIFLLLSTWLSKNLVLSEMKLDPSQSGPNLYLIDVQPDQTAAVAKVLKDLSLPLLEDAPMVTMRIESVKGLKLSAREQGPASDLPSESSNPDRETVRVPRWVMEREYRSSYRAWLNASEKVVDGTWPPGPLTEGAPIPISLEQQLARDLKVRVGDEMVLDVQGVPMRTQVACVRKVDWSRFNLNFFMIFPPGALEAAPQFHVLTTRSPNEAATAELQRNLLRTVPNVSSVDLTSLLATLSSLLDRASGVLELMAGFSLMAGLPILLGSLLNGREQRLKESMLLRTLGADSRQIRTILLVEYSTLGLLAGLSGCILATAAAAAAARWLFKTEMTPVLPPVVLTLFLSTATSLVAGLALGRRVCRRTPLEVLREG